jgi:hypothetical protein
MIARATKLRAETLQDRFVELLPQIHTQARVAFRSEAPERREELIAEVMANCWVAFVRLVERGLIDMAYPTPLAQYAIRQVRTGRRVGAKLNVCDVLSRYAQRVKQFKVERLDRRGEQGGWREILVEDSHAGPAETAAARIDIGDWFASLPKRSRRIAKALGNGERTKEVAKRFGVSAGRVSQVRTELKAAWESFVGEDQESLAAAMA